MQKKIYVICALSNEDAQPIISTLSEEYINSIESTSVAYALEDLQKVYLEKTNNKGLFLENWYEEIQVDFFTKFKKYLESNLNDNINEYFSYSIYNIFYMEVWRIAARRLELDIEFIINRRNILDPLHINAGFTQLKNAFNASYILLKQSSYNDMRYFSTDDFQLNEDYAIKGLKSIFNKTNLYASLMPSDFLINISNTVSSSIDLDSMPYEIKILESLLAHKRFGSKMYIAEDNKELELLSRIMKEDMAIFYWLKNIAKEPKKLQNNFGFFEKEDSHNSIKTNEESLRAAFRKQYQSLRVDNRAYKAKVEELSSVQVSPVKKSPVRQKTKVAPAKKHDTAVTQLTSKERKKAKLKRDPYAFYNDAKNPIVRFLRFLYKEQK